MLTTDVTFMLLEQLELISSDGLQTLVGNLLKQHTKMTEPMLIAFTLLQYGMLNADPLQPPEGRPFPPAINYPTDETVTKQQRCVFLLTRVMGLMPLECKDSLWNADIDFDLASFHAHVRLVMRHIRHLSEACLTNTCLRNPGWIKSFMNQGTNIFSTPG